MIYKLLLLTLLFLVSMTGTQAQDDTDIATTSLDDGAEGTGSPELMSTSTDDDDESSFESSLSESVEESNTDSEDLQSDDDDSNDSSSDSESDEEDECAQLTQTACLDAESADGDQECGYNSVSGECYSIERSQGSYGTGGFDDGYESAKTEAEAQSKQLETLVGILGGIIGVLVLVVAGAGYYIWTKQAKADLRMHRAVSMEVESDPINQTAITA